jgi:hypothetical protein
MSNYINFCEIMYSYEAKYIEKLKLLFQIIVSNASYLCFVQILYRRIFISMFSLKNLIIGIFRSN